MKANTTEQERAQALAEKHGATSYRNRADTQNPAYGFTPIQLAALIAEIEQAARRAPAEPVAYLWQHCETGRTRVVMPDMVITADANWIVVGPLYLAAAPQPPEAAQLDDIGVVDMAQAVDSKEAAPVQLPEPIYTMRVRGRLHEYTPALQAFELDDGEHNLYTEHQVRQLLAAHSIKEQST